MLPLDSPRWQELDPFFGQSEGVPKALGEWWQAIGTDFEVPIYSRQLFDLFLHQGTIRNVSFAVVPWLVAAVTEAESRRAAAYITDIALVEWNRLVHGIHGSRSEGRPGLPPPDWLADDYRAAVEAAGPLAEELLDGPLSDHERVELWMHYPALFGNSKAVSARRYSEAELPEDIQAAYARMEAEDKLGGG
jgi:hypothetical protein